MELLTLDPSFQPLNPVENYESLIWAERYYKYGDFEIRSSDISTLVNLLPRETYICLRDSTVPMIVETHKIVKPLRANPQIVITGRSFETVLERRGSINSVIDPYVGGSHTPWVIDASKEPDAAYLAMRTVLGDTARYQEESLILPLVDPAVTPLDAIPEVDLILPADYVNVPSVIEAPIWNNAVAYVVGNQVRYLGYIWKALENHTNIAPSTSVPTTWERLTSWMPYEIKPQNLYTTVLDLVNTRHRGLKAVRPEAEDPAKVGIEIYNGANLTGEGETGDPEHTVVFDVQFDQVDDATYLLSAQGSTNVGYIFGATGASTVLKTTAPEPGGLARRVLVLDESGDDSTAGATLEESMHIRHTRGLIELYKYNATVLFDGQVADQVAAGYNKNYFLGDILKLVGEYGISQNVRVAEFIRTEDATGEKAYPTFEAVDD